MADNDRFDPVARTVDASGGYFAHADDHPAFEVAPGRLMRLVDSGSMTVNFVTFGADGGFESHHHPEEQISLVFEGEMEITIGETTRRVVAGDLFVIPPNVPHSGRTFAAGCRVLDVYSPARPGLRDLVVDIDPTRAGDIDPWWEGR